MVYLSRPHRAIERRKRPGARTRRAAANGSKGTLQWDFSEDLSVAKDPNVLLPFENPRPSPLLRQQFDQSWKRWKALEAEKITQAEMERQEFASERCRLFGGDVDDDVSLCENMLGVVHFLWGDIDYTED
jgi:hypothetical protein